MRLLTTLMLISLSGKSLARVGGASEKSEKGALRACIRMYPGYNGALGVIGDARVRFNEKEDKLKLSYNLEGLEFTAMGGIHIHEGTTCENAGGHLYNTNTISQDPWSTKYSTDDAGNVQGRTQDVRDGFDRDAHIGRAVVVHNASGVRVGCGVLRDDDSAKCPDEIKACLGPYPGHEGDRPDGSVTIRRRGFSPLNDFVFKYDIKGLELRSQGGIHIHTGRSCDEHSSVGGHFWDSGIDPWLETKYRSNKYGKDRGKILINDGFDYAQHIGRVVVVHSMDGMRVSCGVLQEDNHNC